MLLLCCVNEDCSFKTFYEEEIEWSCPLCDSLLLPLVKHRDPSKLSSYTSATEWLLLRDDEELISDAENSAEE